MFPRWRTVCSLTLQTKIPTRSNSTMTRQTIREKRYQLFTEEKKRQRQEVGRIETINVIYKSYMEEVHLCMNKNISTPLDCARHIKEGLTKLSAVALVNDKVWDVHKPLTDDCELKLVTLLNPTTPIANVAFWRTCSIVLGSIIESAFKDEVQVYPHSFPQPQIKTGSFVHDVFLSINDWQPTSSELRALSAEFVKTVKKDLEIERLEVTEEFALKLFEDNPVKLSQIPDIARSNGDRVTLYNIGDYIDISKGPVIANTHAIGRATVASIHKSPIDQNPNLYRIQGIALPKGIMLNHFAYGLLEARAKNLNESMWVPQSVVQQVEQDPIEPVAARN